MKDCLCTWLLLLLPEESPETDTCYLCDLESHTGNISLGVAGTTEASHQHLVVLLDEVETTITWHESGDLLPVLNQLHTSALTDSGVRLLGLDADFLDNDALGVGGTSEGIALKGSSQMLLLVALVSPSLDATVGTQLARTADSTRFS